MKINFTKMQGLGNDFILIDCSENRFGIRPEFSPEPKFKILAKRLCDRRFGIGADQLLLLYPSNVADFKMRILNADGCEVEMCGNGIRCLAKYIWDRDLSDKSILHIETLAGIIRAEKAADMVKVDMGRPILGVIDYPLRIADRVFKVTCVSMGNPHAIIVVNNISDFPVTYYGPMIENHPVFPKRTNVEFIKILNPSEITMKVWERGAGETMACGTGASAAVVASNIKGLTGKNVAVHLLGGDLFIEWSDEDYVYMTGPATEVFEGTIKSQEAEYV